MSSLPTISRHQSNDRINDIVIKQTIAIYTCLPLCFCQFWSVISVPEPNVFSRDKNEDTSQTVASSLVIKMQLSIPRHVECICVCRRRDDADLINKHIVSVHALYSV